jgi:hypothetical protein
LVAALKLVTPQLAPEPCYLRLDGGDLVLDAV